MGNHISISHLTGINGNTNNKCIICSKQINDNIWIKCNQCNIVLHKDCEIKHRNKTDYTKCLYCEHTGSIGYGYIE